MENVLLIGKGGREHAFAWKIAQSPEVRKLFVFPGSDAIGLEDKCELIPGELDPKTYRALADHAKSLGVDFVFVGPEQPLMDGFTDTFAEQGIKVFAPTKAGAHLEGSKGYAKDFMDRYRIPTPRFITFNDYGRARTYLESMSPWSPVYVKASGLAAGKGALPGETREDALAALERIMAKKEFKAAGDEVVIEDYLAGEEASCIALINSEKDIISPLPFSQDHKKLLDGDAGDNTGGMGAYAPTRLINNRLGDEISLGILGRTLHGLRSDGIKYVGPLYPGVIITDRGPRVLEYNARSGDPETQVILPLISDFYVAARDVAEGRRPVIKRRPGYAVCVVLASREYPGSMKKSEKITGLNEKGNLDMDDVKVFHAGTKLQDGVFYTNGGRVLGVTAYGETIDGAIRLAYDAADKIHFDGMQFRTDIGAREANRK